MPAKRMGLATFCELSDALARGTCWGNQPELVTPQDHEVALANGFLYEHRHVAK